MDVEPDILGSPLHESRSLLGVTGRRGLRNIISKGRALNMRFEIEG